MIDQLVVEKTSIPQGLEIKPDSESGKGYVFSQPIILPYDQNLVDKIEKSNDQTIPPDYFWKVIESFLKDTIPALFPEHFYDALVPDFRGPHWIALNPDKDTSNRHYSHSFDMRKKEQFKKGNEEFEVKTGFMLTADSINGFFPRTKGKQLLPTQGIELTPYDTNIELPHIKVDADRDGVYIDQVTIPILRVLLEEEYAIFFPNHYSSKIDHQDIGSYAYGSACITLKDSQPATIKKGMEYNNRLNDFLNAHYEEVKSLINDFSQAKEDANIPFDKNLEQYKEFHLYKHFNKIQNKALAFKKQVPQELMISELYK